VSRSPSVLMTPGYPVDGGTGGFVDAANITPLCGDDDYNVRLMTVLESGESDFAAGTLTDAEGRPFLAVFSSGGGDGWYPTWVGRSADGEVACFLTDFLVLKDDEDDEPPSVDGDRTPVTPPCPADTTVAQRESSGATALGRPTVTRPVSPARPLAQKAQPPARTVSKRLR
jgi:hypothetical protein